MSEWAKASIGDFFDLIPGYAFKSAEFTDIGVPVIKIKNIKAGHFSEHEFSYVSPHFLGVRADKLARQGDLLISMSGNRHDGSPETWVGKIAIFQKTDHFFINQRVGSLRRKAGAKIDLRFSSFLLSSIPYQELFIAIATSSGGQANLSPQQILSAPLPRPDLKTQIAIGEILGALDDKAAINRRMNETLEAIAQLFFKDWFVDFGPTRAKMDGRAPYLAPDIWLQFPNQIDNEDKPMGWKIEPLDQIAEFLNGIALQKYPPTGEQSLPVIKIAELRAGSVANSDRASAEIPVQYIVEDGDVLFSWSGSLLHRIWTAGRGALNQHLFKVTSNRFPKWFYFHWIGHHMEDFRATAASKATTMGHIQRHHLSQAMTVVPSAQIMKAADEVIGPVFERSIQNDLECQTLAAARDLLLPKLMSGKIRVNDAEKIAEAAL
jgi:type I restriction enzyme, S subunit